MTSRLHLRTFTDVPGVVAALLNEAQKIGRPSEAVVICDRADDDTMILAVKFGNAAPVPVLYHSHVWDDRFSKLHSVFLQALDDAVCALHGELPEKSDLAELRAIGPAASGGEGGVILLPSSQPTEAQWSVEDMATLLHEQEQLRKRSLGQPYEEMHNRGPRRRVRVIPVDAEKAMKMSERYAMAEKV